jgi:hypothetical protein
MRAPTRHPRLSAAACQLYGLTIWMYPRGFRRTFGRELIVTFRNRVEDVLDEGGILDWLGFAVHIAVDSVRTCGALLTEARPHDARSLLGLSEGNSEAGSIERRTFDVSLVLAAGIVLTCVVWYTYVTYVILL